MQTFILSITLAISATAALAQPVQRDGYIRRDGTYVAPSYSTRPNDTKLDNYSTQGNYNPYSGKTGTTLTSPPIPTAAAMATRQPRVGRNRLGECSQCQSSR